jgi:hypothetical protein
VTRDIYIYIFDGFSSPEVDRVALRKYALYLYGVCMRACVRVCVQRQARQYKYDVTLKCIRVTIVSVDKQEVLNIMNVCL